MNRLVVGLLAFLALARPAWAGPDDSPLKVGDTAPPFAMRTLNPDLAKVKQFALSKHVTIGGEKPAEPKAAVVLSFAASYCEPCKKELAQLHTLAARLERGGVALAVVIIDTEPDGLESMRKLTVDELKLAYPVLADRFGVLARRYRATTLPYVVIIGKSGAIEWIHSGFSERSLETLMKKLGV
jgi:alkyl hydroperoxide reductase subunit AhpC